MSPPTGEQREGPAALSGGWGARPRPERGGARESQGEAAPLLARPLGRGLERREEEGAPLLQRGFPLALGEEGRPVEGK